MVDRIWRRVPLQRNNVTHILLLVVFTVGPAAKDPLTPLQYPAGIIHQDSGPRLNIKTVFSRYGDSHVKDKTVGETVLSLTWESLYW